MWQIKRNLQGIKWRINLPNVEEAEDKSDLKMVFKANAIKWKCYTKKLNWKNLRKNQLI